MKKGKIFFIFLKKSVKSQILMRSHSLLMFASFLGSARGFVGISNVGFARVARISLTNRSPASPTASLTSLASLTSPTDNDFDGYSSKTAFMFPGQGAQVVGMAKGVTEEVSYLPP